MSIMGIEADFPIRKLSDFNKFSLFKKTTKTMEEGGPSFGNNFFRNAPARDCFF